MNKEPTILLVDDDEDFVRVARRAIRRSGLDVHLSVAHDGGEALSALGLENTASSADGALAEAAPVVVLLDLNMPVLDGLQVLSRIRHDAATQRLPVVVVSSSNRPSDVQRSYALGANSFVVKRYDSGRPGAYLVDAIRYWVELNEPPPSRMDAGA
jgi:two-component system response regulator